MHLLFIRRFEKTFNETKKVPLLTIFQCKQWNFFSFIIGHIIKDKPNYIVIKYFKLKLIQN